MDKKLNNYESLLYDTQQHLKEQKLLTETLEKKVYHLRQTINIEKKGLSKLLKLLQ